MDTTRRQSLSNAPAQETITTAGAIRTRSMSRTNISSATSSSSKPSTTTTSRPRTALASQSQNLNHPHSLPPPRSTSSRSLAAIAESSLSGSGSRSVLSNNRRRSSEVGLPVQGPPGTIGSHARSTPSTTTTTTTGVSSRRRVIGLSSSRLSSNGASVTRGGSSGGIGHRISKSTAANVQGMGIVKSGPRVVSPQKKRVVVSPTMEDGGKDDPFSLSFEPPEWARGSVVGKRPFEEEDAAEEGKRFDGRHGEYLGRSTMPSPKRALFERVGGNGGLGQQQEEDSYPKPFPPASPLGPRPFDLTSPKKPSLAKGITLTTTTSPRLHFRSPTHDPERQNLLFPPSNSNSHSPHPHSPMRVDGGENQPLPPPPSSSPFNPMVARQKQARKDDSDDDDEIDFLSPRKKQKGESSSGYKMGMGSRTVSPSASAGSIRSPPHKVRPSGSGNGTGAGGRQSLLMLPPPFSNLSATGSPLSFPVHQPSERAVSVPMERKVYPMPPLPSGRRTSSSNNPTTIDTHLLTTSPFLTSTSTSASSAKKDGQSPTFNTAFAFRGLPPSSAYYSPSSSSRPSPPGTATAVAPHAPPSSSFKSGIPRLAATVAHVNPVKAELPIQEVEMGMDLTSASSVRSRLLQPTSSGESLLSASTCSSSSTTTEDVSMAMSEPVGPNVSMVSNSSTGSGSAVGMGMGDETAKRLANLQAMLSRLAMPKAAPAPVTQPATGTTRSSSSRDYLVPLAPPDDSQPRKVGSRTSLGSGGVGLKGTTTTSNLPRRKSLEKPGTAAAGLAMKATLGPSVGSNSSTSSLASLSSSTSNSSRRALGVGTILPLSSSTATIAAAAAGVEGEVSSNAQNNVLQGVIAFVDVRTGDGDDAGMIFVDMLKSMGARVTTRPTLTLTHIVYKSGRPGTLHRYRQHPEPKPFLVGISWVVRCAEVGARVDEKPYVVESAKEAVFQKRRRSMEPKALATLGSSTNGGTTANETALKATIAASIERVRRKSLQFAPKVSSPLAKRVWVMPEEDEDDS